MTLPPLENLVPHGPPMRLLDELVAHDAQGATCRVRLSPVSTFVVDGRVPAIVALEYMAQCIAAFATLHPSHSGGDARDGANDCDRPLKPRIGYLVGARQLDLQVDHFSVGDELRITVQHVWGNDQGAQFSGVVERDGVTLASGQLTVYVPPEGAGLPMEATP